MDMQFDIEDLASAYVAIRDEREAKKAQFESADKVLTDQMDQLESVMLDICNGLKVESIKTKQGLIMRSLKTRFGCNDWDGFGKFILENGLVPLLEKRIHQGNFQKYIEEQPADAGLPPGVNVSREFVITVRRPSSK